MNISHVGVSAVPESVTILDGAVSVCPPDPVDRCGQTGRRVLCRVEVSQEHGRGAAASRLAPAGLLDCLCASGHVSSVSLHVLNKNDA